MDGLTGPDPAGGQASPRGGPVPWARLNQYLARHPVARTIGMRLVTGAFTLVLVSVVVFVATQALPGNAAVAALGMHSSRAQLAVLQRQLGLQHPLVTQYFHWLHGVLTGSLLSLSSHTVGLTNVASANPGGYERVSSIIIPCLENSGVLVAVSGVIGITLAMALGIVAAIRQDGVFDTVMSTFSLAITSVPEFVVGIILVILFSTNLFHLFPAVFTTLPGQLAFESWRTMILPVLTLVFAVLPYTFRMVRATLIESLHSDYAELAALKGMPQWRIVLVHALPNAVPAIVQAIAGNVRYLAGGIVVVEEIFNYPGIGRELVSAITARDIPTIQTAVLTLAAFYIVVNIVADAVALCASPRRRSAGTSSAAPALKAVTR